MLAGLTETPEYRDWQWDMAQRMRAGLESAYATEPDELECIRALLKAVGSTPSVHARSAPRVSVTVESAYLHGHRSQVKFTVGGIEHQRELADVLTLGSFVEKGSLKWQRACFIQAKREKTSARQTSARFDIDEWQLSLLRAFPKFEGVNGLLDGLSCHLRNHSGMLGAYGLLTAPGEISVVSAKILHSVLAGRNSCSPKDILPAMLSEANDRVVGNGVLPSPWWPFDPDHCPICRDMMDHLWPFPWRELWRHPPHHHTHPTHWAGDMQQPASSRLACLGLDEFVDAWSSLRLGEIWYPSSAALSDRALRDFILRLVSRTSSATGNLGHIRNLIASCADDPKVPREPDERPWREKDGGLIILSAVATTEGEG